MPERTYYLNRLLPGFQAMGFSQKLNEMLRAQNVNAVRAHLPVLQEKLKADTNGPGLGLNVLGADLLALWNAICDELDTHAAITIRDYAATCKVVHVEDFGVQWKQLCLGLDREPGLSGTYALHLGDVCTPFHYQ